MEKREFEILISQAVDMLPENIRQKLNNVEVVLEEGKSPNNSLFGLYHGVPQIHRGSTYGYSPTLPDKITIYKGTIEKYAGDESRLPAVVRRVVWHEIGHHFGFDEAQIRKLEEKWQRKNKV